MSIEKDSDDQFSEENKKHRTVKYHKHGILRKFFNLDKEEIWAITIEGETLEFHDGDFIDILDDLSKDGYELICRCEEGFILRTKNKVEEIEEYWDID